MSRLAVASWNAYGRNPAAADELTDSLHFVGASIACLQEANSWSKEVIENFYCFSESGNDCAILYKPYLDEHVKRREAKSGQRFAAIQFGTIGVVSIHLPDGHGVLDGESENNKTYRAMLNDMSKRMTSWRKPAPRQDIPAVTQWIVGCDANTRGDGAAMVLTCVT